MSVRQRHLAFYCISLCFEFIWMEKRGGGRHSSVWHVQMFSGPLPVSGQGSLHHPDVTAGFPINNILCPLFPYPGNPSLLFWSSLWWWEAETHLSHGSRAGVPPWTRSVPHPSGIRQGGRSFAVKIDYWQQHSQACLCEWDLATSVHKPELLPV